MSLAVVSLKNVRDAGLSQSTVKGLHALVQRPGTWPGIPAINIRPARAALTCAWIIRCAASLIHASPTDSVNVRLRPVNSQRSCHLDTSPSGIEQE